MGNVCVCACVCLSVCLSVSLSVCLSVCEWKKEREYAKTICFCCIWIWQRCLNECYYNFSECQFAVNEECTKIYYKWKDNTYCYSLKKIFKKRRKKKKSLWYYVSNSNILSPKAVYWITVHCVTATNTFKQSSLIENISRREPKINWDEME